MGIDHYNATSDARVLGESEPAWRDGRAGYIRTSRETSTAAKGLSALFLPQPSSRFLPSLSPLFPAFSHSQPQEKQQSLCEIS